MITGPTGLALFFSLSLFHPPLSLSPPSYPVAPPPSPPPPSPPPPLDISALQTEVASLEELSRQMFVDYVDLRETKVA